MGVMDFFSQEEAQRRRRALDAFFEPANRKIYETSQYYLGPHMTNFLSSVSKVPEVFSSAADFAEATAASKRLMQSQGLLNTARNVGQFAATMAGALMPGNQSGVMSMAQKGTTVKPKTKATAKKPSLVSPVPKYKDIPVINPKDLIGAKIQPTVADLLDAGRFYKGIDSSEIDVPVALKGGVMYPMQKNEQAAKMMWADKRKTAEKKIKSDADFVGVSVMNPNSHRSNFSTIDAITQTVKAYIRDGRMSSENIKKLDNLVRAGAVAQKGSNAGTFKELALFPSFLSPKLDEYLDQLPFETRKKIADVIDSKEAKKLGVPNVRKIINETVDKQFSGMNPRDTVLLLRPDKQKELLELKREGLLGHPSYEVGISGLVEGRYENPVSMATQYPDFVASRRAMGAPEQGDIRAFDLSKPIQEITEPVAKGILDATGYKFIDQPRQGLVLFDAISGNWKTNLVNKNKGGLAPVDYEDALKLNPSAPSLTMYSAKDVMKGAKTGDLTVYQLSDKEIYFGIDNKPDYSWMGNIPELGKNEKALVGVVSNELGAKGVAAPSVVLKAIEEGVTILDAFAVKSKKHPKGFLPKYYSRFGFKTIKTVPFDKDIYLESHTINEYNDLVKNWEREGWTPEFGMPDVVLMKWAGDENVRSNATKRFFVEDTFGSGSGTAGQSTPTARQLVGQSPSRDIGREQRRRLQDNQGRNTGIIRDDNTGDLSLKSQRVAQGLLNLTPEQAKNIGIDPVGLLNLVGK